ncbi:MAG: tetratricopeptide repeat protein, partial [Candidatus Woesearchaeota archaeon]|nr:tetratricopeptide repeat protein [Candidatus Woesearchaeota archaeon]
MSRRTTALVAALSLLPLGQPLLLGSTTALATAAVVLSTQAAHAQSAADYVNAGIEKGESGDSQGAIADFTKAIEINPQYAIAYSNRGNAKYDLGNYQGAIADYNKAIEINPQDARAYYNRGIAKRKSGDYQGAI